MKERKTIRYYLGVDEVGRGALAGPLIVCVLEYKSSTLTSKKVTDSKKLSKREMLQFWRAYKTKFNFSFGIVWPSEIDKLGMTFGTKLAIERALNAISYSSLNLKNLDLYIDGNFKFSFDKVKKTFSVIKGDLSHKGISLASIFAKVYRDEIMRNYDTIYPSYNFKSNVGYGSSLHLNSIKIHSIVRIHRKLFLRKFNEKNLISR